MKEIDQSSRLCRVATAAEIVPGALEDLLTFQIPRYPKIIIDTREQVPLRFEHLPTVMETLQTADYSLVGMEEIFAVERKTVPDLIGSLTGDRDRFLRECHRLRGFRFRRLVVVGRPEEIHQAHVKGRCRNPKAVLAGLAVVEARYDVPVCWFPCPQAAAAQIERWAWWQWRETLKAATGANVETPPWAVGLP